MYSIVPFTVGAAIAAGILVAFAPHGTVPVLDSPPAIAQTPATVPPANPPSDTAPADKSLWNGLKGGGSSDGSTGPNRPNANTADTGDAAKGLQEERLRQQQRDGAGPSKSVPGAK